MADTSAYPGALDGDLRALVALGTTPSASEDFLQLVADAVAKVEAELGTNPSGPEATVAARLTADEGGLATHLADGTDAHDASAISFVPAGTIAATTVQAAVEEVATEYAAADTALDGRLDTVEATLPDKAPLASPALTGTPTAPTAAAGDNTTKIATTAHVQGEMAAEVARADGAYLPPFPAGGSSRYYRLPNTAVTTAVVSAGTFRAWAAFIPRTVTLDRIGGEVTAAGDAGSKFRIGIYADNNGAPDGLVLDAGTINGDAVAVQEITINQQLTRGWYWFGGATQLVSVTAPTMRSTNLSPGLLPPSTYQLSAPSAGSLVTLNMTGVTDELPATFTVAASAGGVNTASIFARFA